MQEIKIDDEAVSITTIGNPHSIASSQLLGAVDPGGLP